eukprot:PhM_4_TR13120/c0_g1_i1/m.1791
MTRVHPEPLATYSSVELVPVTSNSDQQRESLDPEALKKLPEFDVRPVMPIFLDLIHNNARSRLFSVLTVAFIVALILLYFIVDGFGSITDSGTGISFVGHPPTAAVVGRPIQNFTIVARDVNGVEVSGVQVSVTLTPASTIPLRGRSVDCYLHALLPRSSPFVTENDQFCQPSAHGHLHNSVQTTDSQGFAVFKDLTLTFGAPVSYNVLVEAVDGITVLSPLRAIITYSSDVTRIEVTNTIPSALGSEDTVLITAKVTRVSAALANLHAGIVALNIQQKDVDATRELPFVPNGNDNLAAELTNNFAVVSPNGEFTVRTTLRGTTSSMLYLAVYCAGVVELVPTDLASKIHLPASVTTALGSPQLSFVGSLPAQVDEVQFFNLTAKLSASSGTVDGRRVVCALQPIGNIQTPKTLVSGVSARVSDGIVRFTNLLFSSPGDVGTYAVNFVVDGLTLNTWTVTVVSAVNQSAVMSVIDPLPWGTGSISVTVGRPWDVTPRVQLVQRNTNLPIVGKLASLVPRDSATTGLNYRAISSNDAGWAMFTNVLITFAMPSGYHTIDVVVDGSVVGNFAIYVQYDTNTLNCTAIRIPISDMYVGVGMPAATRALVHNQLGAGVGLQAIAHSVSAVDSSVRFTYNSSGIGTWSDLYGNVALGGFVINTLSTKTAILRLKLSTAVCSSIVDIFVRRRSSALRLASSPQTLSSQSFSVQGRVDVNSWSVVTDAAPVSAKAELVSSPDYLSYHPASDLPVSSEAKIFGPQNSDFTLIITFPVFLPGNFTFVLTSEGVVDPNAFKIAITEDGGMTVLDLVTSPLGNPSTIIVTAPLVVQPVLTLKTSSGQPIANARVFAELVRVGSDKNVPLDYHANTTHLIYGAVGSLAEPKLLPYSSVSDSMGYVYFNSLSVLGVDTKYSYTMQYRFGPSSKVVDKDVFDLSSQQTMQASVVVPPSIFAVPGMKLGRTFSTLVMTSSARPVSRTIGIPIVYEGNSALPDLGTTFSISTSSVWQAADIVVPSEMPPARYRFSMLLPGGQSAPTSTVTVTKDPYSLEVLSEIPTNLVVGHTISIDVEVRVADGGLIPNVRVAVEVISSNSSCIATECGRFGGSSTAAVSDSTGVAHFDLNLMAAQEGEYIFRFSAVVAGASVLETILGFATPAQDVASINSADLTKQAQALGVPIPSTAVSSFDLGQTISDAQSSATANVQSSLIATAVTSSLERKLQEQSQVSVQTSVIRVWNNVGRVEIIADAAISRVGASSSQQQIDKALFAARGTFKQQPIVRVLSRWGQPLAGKKVDVVVLPTVPILQLSFKSTVTTDQDGYYRFEGLGLQTLAAGTFHLMYICEGVSNVSRATFSTDSALASSTVLEQYTFHLLSGLAVFIMSPLFFANFPLKSPLWIAGSLGLVLFVVSWDTSRVWVELNTSSGSNTFLRLHLSLLIALWSLLFGGLLILAGAFFARYEVAKRQISAVIDLANKYKQRFHRTNVYYAYTKDRFSKEPQMKIRDAIFLPSRYMVTITGSLVVLTVLWYFGIYVMSVLLDAIDVLRNRIPQPPEHLTDEQRSQINTEMQAAVRVGASAIVSIDMRLGFIQTLATYLQDIDIFLFWETLFNILDEMSNAVKIAGWSAAIVGGTAVALNMVTMTLVLPEKYERIRRGEMPEVFKKSTKLVTADKYMGIQLMHFVLGHQLVYWIVFLVVLLLFTPYLVRFIAQTFYMTILVSIITVLITVFFELVIVGVIWVKGRVIKWHRAYFIWSIYALIAGIANGVSLTIARFIKAMFAISVFFARLDMDLLPEQFMFLDLGYWSFYSMLFVDEEYNNPIALTFTSILTAEWAVRRQLKYRGKEEFDMAAVPNIVMYPHVLRMIDHYVEDHGVDTLVAQAMEPEARRRAKLRWRLLVLLLRNPSLCEHRKWNLNAPKVSLFGRILSRVKAASPQGSMALDSDSGSSGRSSPASRRGQRLRHNQNTEAGAADPIGVENPIVDELVIRNVSDSEDPDKPTTTGSSSPSDVPQAHK